MREVFHGKSFVGGGSYEFTPHIGLNGYDPETFLSLLSFCLLIPLSFRGGFAHHFTQTVLSLRY